MKVFLAPRALSALLAFASTAMGQAFWNEHLPVRAYQSPSKELELRVVPSARDGSGPATYRLARGDQTLWEGTKDFSFRDAALADDGVVIGYSYGDGGCEFGSNLRILVLDAKGHERLDDLHAREPSRFFHFPPNPRVIGLFVQAAVDRFVVRLADEDVNRGREMWWSFRISTGELFERVRPDERIPRPENHTGVSEVRPLHGTPLLLLRWEDLDYGAASMRAGARFAVVDPAFKAVWELIWPDDLSGGQNGEEAYERLDAARRQDAMPERSNSGRFALRSFRENEVHEFIVEPSPSASLGWSVRELEFTPVEVATQRPVPYPEFEPVRLPDVNLEAEADDPVRSFRSVAAFAFGSKDRLRVAELTSETGSCALHVIEASGTLVSRVVIPSLADAKMGVTNWASFDRTRWLAVYSPHEDQERSRAWIVDERRGKYDELTAFEAPAPEFVAVHPGGGFVVVDKSYSRGGVGTSGAGLLRLDEEGRIRWALEERYEDPKHIFSVRGLAVLPNGDIAVLDGTRHWLQVFSDEGEHLRNEDLAVAWSKQPGYLCDLQPASNGGLLVLDFEDRSILRISNREGNWGPIVAPHSADGPIQHLTAAQVAPSGHVWATDGRLLLRLDATGRVDQVLGEPILSKHLVSPGAAAIDARGRIYVQDARSAAVHVFGPDGAKLRVCMPHASDFDKGALLGELVANGNGAVMARRQFLEKEWVRFDENGVRLGRVELGTRAWPHADPHKIWAATQRGFELHDLEKGVLHAIERFPDEQWISGIAASAPDGSLAVLTAHENSIEGPKSVLLILDPNGAVKLYRHLPLLPSPYAICFCGRQVVFSTSKGEFFHLAVETCAVQLLKLSNMPAYDSCTLALSPAGTELWCVDATSLRVLRWSLPPL